jgi:hypothetical protein
MKNQWQSVAGVVYPSYHVALPPLSIMERIWTYSQVTKPSFDKNNIFEPLLGTAFSACIKIDNKQCNDCLMGPLKVFLVKLNNLRQIKSNGTYPYSSSPMRALRLLRVTRSQTEV